MRSTKPPRQPTQACPTHEDPSSFGPKNSSDSVSPRAPSLMSAIQCESSAPTSSTGWTTSYGARDIRSFASRIARKIEKTLTCSALRVPIEVCDQSRSVSEGAGPPAPGNPAKELTLLRRVGGVRRSATLFAGHGVNVSADVTTLRAERERDTRNLTLVRVTETRHPHPTVHPRRIGRCPVRQIDIHATVSQPCDRMGSSLKVRRVDALRRRLVGILVRVGIDREEGSRVDGTWICPERVHLFIRTWCAREKPFQSALSNSSSRIDSLVAIGQHVDRFVACKLRECL